MVFRDEPTTILAEYQTTKDEPGFDLAAFINRRFSMPVEGPSVSPAIPGEALESYIARLWDVLTHRTTEPVDRSSLLPLPYPYVVPGGRFRELYYWDTYFTMLGLEADKRYDLAHDMVRDIAFEIDCYGHVPNGNRTYYLSRSQPPFFALMLDLIASREGQKTYLEYLPELEAEYEYWMDGSVMLRPGQAYRRVTRLADGPCLTAIGMIWRSHGMNRTARILRRHSAIMAIPATCSAICARQPSRAGTSALDGLGTVTT